MEKISGDRQRESDRRAMGKTEKPYAYVRQHYGVDPVPGARVKMGERPGTIAHKRSYDHYVYVRFDDIKHPVPVHPLDLTYDRA